MFKCKNFDLEMDLSRLHNIHIFIYVYLIKLYHKWKHVVCCHVAMFAFFLNCDLYMIKVCTPFSYPFGNIGTVSNFWTPHDKIL